MQRPKRIKRIPRKQGNGGRRMSGGHPLCADRSGNGDVTIMMSLYDEEEIMKSYIKSERYEERQIATQEKAIKTAINMIRDNKLLLEDISRYTDLSLEEVKKLEEEIMQLS
jgi:predicted HTH domain antitoxin